MRKIALTALLAGLFLLMLSALVVTPEDQTPEAHLPPAPILHAVFLPMTQTAAPAAVCVLTERAEDENTAAQNGVLCTFGPPAPRHTDSNGRILRASRYENSVYQVFRAEVAGG